MITGLDHVVIAASDFERGARAYETLLGARTSSRTTRDGVATALIATQNVGVEVMAPVGEAAVRLRAALDQGGEGLKSLVFAVADIEAAHRRCARVGLQPEAIADREEGGAIGWRSFRLDTARTRGVRLFCIERMRPPARAESAAAGVEGLDHVVIRTAAPEGAAALFGARLGLDLRLDREISGGRLLFFRCGDAVVELVADDTLDPAQDQLWGLSWRVGDAEASRARLLDAGLPVSEVRSGHKPGTRVFTVRDGTLGVPTIMLETLRNRD